MIVHRIRLSGVVLWTAMLAMLLLLVLLRGDLAAAHEDESIHFVASDAATYFTLYQDFYADLDLKENPALFLIGSPILFMKLAAGDLFLIQACNLLLMAVTLTVAFKCFATLRGRVVFLIGSLAFPYFLFGFLSLNKEIYAMCSAIFFASYMVRGRLTHLLAALLLAACARYYMLFAMLSLLALIPRSGGPRYRWIFALLLFISLVAPIAKSLVPEYSSEDVLEVSGVTGLIFAKIIDFYGYVLVYPIKYLTLIPLRAYSFLLASGRAGDGMEAIVSIASLVVVVLAFRILRSRRPASTLVSKLILAAFVAPITMMWSDIMHWRYYSFVYFFYLFAVVLHFVERHRALPLQRAAVLNA